MDNCNCKSHSNVNILTRRSFLDRSFKVGLGVALSTLVDIPLVVKRALAEGNIGVPGPNGKVKKLLFIFLRGANDGLNSVVPILDSAYSLPTVRPTTGIGIPADAGTDYSILGQCDFPISGAGPTFGYANAIRTGNGFAALHPSLKFLARFSMRVTWRLFTGWDIPGSRVRTSIPRIIGKPAIRTTISPRTEFFTAPWWSPASPTRNP